MEPDDRKRQLLAEARGSYLEKRELLLQKNVDKLGIKLFDQIFEKHLKDLKVDANGALEKSNANIAMVRDIDRIYNSFALNYNTPVIKSFVNDLSGIGALNEKYFDEVSQQPAAVSKQAADKIINQQLGIDSNGKPIKDGFVDKFARSTEVRDKIKQETLKAITQGKGFQQFRRDLRETIQGHPGKSATGSLHQYYRNNAYDTYSKVDRTYSDLIAKDLKLTFFYWSGGVINTTRALCRHMNAKIVNALDFKKLKYKDLKIIYRPGVPDGKHSTWVPLKDLGGYGCRHRKDYISTALAMKRQSEFVSVNSISNTHFETTLPQAEFKKQFNNFEKDNKLKGKDAKLQEKSIKKVLTDKPKLTSDYIERFGNVANTDDARKLFEDLGYNGLNASAVHEASSAITKDVVNKLLATSKENSVEMYAGGAGSGKTSAISTLKPNLKNTSAAIIDGNLSSYESAIKKLDQFVSLDKTVNISYVYRDPVDAWENGVIKRMLENVEEKGRVVKLSTFIENTEGSYNTVKRMFDDGIDTNPLVNIDIIDNSLGRGNTAFMNREKFDSIKYGDLKQTLLKRTKELLDSGRINKAQYDELIK